MNLDIQCKDFIEKVQTINFSNLQARFISNLILREKPRILVEIGTWLFKEKDFFSYEIWDSGVTSTRIHLIACYRLEQLGINSKLYSIEILPDINQKIIENSPFGKYWIPILNQDSRKLKWNGEIDYLFIDGDHHKVNCLNDLEHYSPYLSKNGVIINHDGYSYEVPNAIEEFLRRHPDFFRIHHRIPRLQEIRRKSYKENLGFKVLL